VDFAGNSSPSDPRRASFEITGEYCLKLFLSGDQVMSFG
jgi:hypothetical protein